MNKFTLVTSLLISGASILYAQDTKEFLRSVQSLVVPDEYNEFYYNAGNQLDSIVWSLPISETEISVGSRKLYYGDNNKVILRDLFQIIDFVNRKTGKVEYTYGENGLVLERKNYMDFMGNGTMVLQGHLKYYYDAGNMIIRMESLNPWEEYIMEYTEYSYTDNRLSEETVYKLDEENWSDEFVFAQKLTYEYDSNGRKLKETTLLADANGNPYENEKTDYVYDEAGNLTEKNTFLNKGSWVPARSEKYVYDLSVKAENVVYPLDSDDYEMFANEVYGYCSNKIVQDSLWLEFEGNWGLYNVNDYIYENVPAPASVGRYEILQQEELGVITADGMIYLKDVKEGEQVAIYDNSGRILVATLYQESGIPVANLPTGTKIIKAAGKTAKFL